MKHASLNRDKFTLGNFSPQSTSIHMSSNTLSLYVFSYSQMHTYYNIAEMILLIMQNHQRQKLVDVNFSFISLNLNNQTYTVVHFISIFFIGSEMGFHSFYTKKYT